MLSYPTADFSPRTYIPGYYIHKYLTKRKEVSRNQKSSLCQAQISFFEEDSQMKITRIQCSNAKLVDYIITNPVQYNLLNRDHYAPPVP